MASSQDYAAFVVDQLGGLDGITSRKMMGEYLLYYRGKIVGGIYDDRLLLKITQASCRYFPQAAEECPYPGAKPMLLVEEVDDAALLCRAVEAMEPELPAPKKRAKHE